MIKSRHVLIGAGAVAAIYFGGSYLLKLNRLSNELESDTKVSIHNVSLSSIELSINVKLKNPSGGSIQVKHPFVKMIYGDKTIASSQVKDANIEIPKFSEVNLDPIKIKLGFLTLATTVPALVKEYRETGKLNLVVHTITTINDSLPYTKTDNITLGGNDTTIRKSADVEDTMNLIRKALPQTVWQTEKIAKVLKGSTLEETCSNIWHFVYQHIQYKRDKEGVEQVRSPRRAWGDRESGVDCDCYTVFILSILRALGIPSVARITKYPKRYPEIPRWQHVYPIVPKPGHMSDYSEARDHYIVLDCVKDRFDDEQPFLECKDYNMRLDYLDGFDGEDAQDEELQFSDYDNVDLSDLASIYDDEEMGNIFKKIGGAVKTAAKKVGTVVKKVGDKVGDGIRFLNRYVNPATILLRNGFLLAMKVNLMNVAGRLRYAYLTDAQAQAKGINLSELKKVRSVKDRAETVYWQAGGKKENLKKAILSGKGNKDKKVPLSGFEGVDGLDNVYADEDEYNIIHSDGFEGLGEIASGTAIAAATSAVAAIAGALKQVKGLFNKGGNEEKAFQSETDNAGTASELPTSVAEDEMRDDYSETAPTAQPSSSSLISKVTSAVSAAKPLVSTARTLVPTQTTPKVSSPSLPATTVKTNETTQNYSSTAETTQPVLSNESASSGAMLVPSESASPGSALQTQDNAAKAGFIQKTTTWVKENPGKSLLVAGGVIAGGVLLMKAMRGGSATNGLNGTPPKKNKVKKGKTGKTKTKTKVKAQNLL